MKKIITILYCVLAHPAFSEEEPKKVSEIDAVVQAIKTSKVNLGGSDLSTIDLAGTIAVEISNTLLGYDSHLFGAAAMKARENLRVTPILSNKTISFETLEEGGEPLLKILQRISAESDLIFVFMKNCKVYILPGSLPLAKEKFSIKRGVWFEK